MEPKMFVAVKAFIVFNGKVLNLRESPRYEDTTQTGNYDVPGGRVKPGERFDQSLIREVKEETGLDIKIGNPLAVSEWRPVVRGESWQVVAVFFECSVESDQVTLSSDHDHYIWIDPKDYKKYKTIPTNWTAFEAYLNK